MTERGSITLWMVGMVMVVFLVGGIAIDLWRGLAAHRQVASIVDAAAVAAGSGIDEEAWRATGNLVLRDAAVEDRVAQSVAGQPGAVTVSVVTAGDGSSATVTGVTTVELTLLGLVTPDGFVVSATATAAPALSP